MLSPPREDLLRSLRAISDPLRLRMVVLLAHPPGPRIGPFAEGEPGMCVSDLRSRIGRAHALVSHHVQVLLRAGLIRRVRRGRWSLLQLDVGRLASLADQIASLALEQFGGLTAEDIPVTRHPDLLPRLGAAAATVLSLTPRASVACSGTAGAPSW